MGQSSSLVGLPRTPRGSSHQIIRRPPCFHEKNRGQRHRETFVAAFRQTLDMDAPKCGPDTCSVYKADDNIESAIGAEF